MRFGVLDVGSNTVHLLVVDGHPGAPPVPAHKVKLELRLAELMDPSGAITKTGRQQLVAFVAETKERAEEFGAEELLAFATSAIREASNTDEVLAAVRDETGVVVDVLSGVDEARFTFFAARRWLGWSSGRLLVLDIGGGSLEVAVGSEEEPEAAISAPLGAGRLTADHLDGDPPSPDDVAALRSFARRGVARDLGRIVRAGVPDSTVATSKTWRSLARIGGAAPSADGPFVRRTLKRATLEEWVPRLAGMTTAERGRLPGVSPGRAGQLLAGAIVAEATLALLGLDEVQICPWALREGVILRRIDALGLPGAPVTPV